MSEWSSLIPYFAALGLVSVSLGARLNATAVYRWTLAAAALALMVSLGAAVAALSQPFDSPTLGSGALALGLRFDLLSTTLAVLVTTVGLVVTQFSRNYLAGDPEQSRFFAAVGLTLAAVMMLALAGTLAQLVLAWVGTSLSLHRLLIFYPNRPRARSAAHKKFIVARCGDVALGIAALLIFKEFGSGSIAAISDAAQALNGPTPANLQWAAVLLAIAAMLKSAQFPTHGWLLEVMETPTPVSALLHAGIINAGGFLIIRFADVMVAVPGALHTLAIVGAVTAIFGSLAMLTENRVKVSLAYSTVAQMGFMLLQCGVGAFALATLHLVAHSFYKAHAFLASGSAIEAFPRSTKKASVSGRGLATGGLVGITTFLLFSYLLHSFTSVSPATWALSAILLLGLLSYGASAASGHPRVFTLLVPGAAIVAFLYIASELAAARFFAGTLPQWVPSWPSFAILILTVICFSVISIMQLIGPDTLKGPSMRRVYVHLRSGFYASLLVDRALGRIRSGVNS